MLGLWCANIGVFVVENLNNKYPKEEFEPVPNNYVGC